MMRGARTPEGAADNAAAVLSHGTPVFVRGQSINQSVIHSVNQAECVRTCIVLWNCVMLATAVPSV